MRIIKKVSCLIILQEQDFLFLKALQPVFLKGKKLCVTFRLDLFFIVFINGLERLHVFLHYNVF